MPITTAACSDFDFDCDGTAAQCIPEHDVCDGTEDCDNGKDEDNCYNDICKYLQLLASHHL